MTLQSFAKQAGRVLSDNSPAILTGLAVGGVLTSVILAVKATPEAARRLETAAIDKDILDDDGNPIRIEHTMVETVKLTWKLYIPTGLSVLATGACIIGANSINTRRQAAMITAYTLTEKAYTEYREQVKEVLGKTKDQTVLDAVAKKRMETDPVADKEVYVIGTGEQLCYDKFSGRYFKSDMETIRKAVNDINEQINNELYASLNEFYRKVGLPENDMGEIFGWHSSLLEVSFSAQLQEGKPCMTIDFRTDPIRNYHRVF